MTLLNIFSCFLKITIDLHIYCRLRGQVNSPIYTFKVRMVNQGYRTEPRCCSYLVNACCAKVIDRVFCLFQLELKKKELDELKSQHLEEFIEKVRKELKSWWDLCYYGAGQREQFEPYHSTDYSEELLEKHEFELDRIKSHYNHNSSLFAMVSLILRVT